MLSRPSGQDAWLSVAYLELVDVLSRTTAKSPIDWPASPASISLPNSTKRFPQRPKFKAWTEEATVFLDLHHEISRFWNQPFSSPLTNAAATDFTDIVGSVEQGYTSIPVVENTLASHLSGTLLKVPPDNSRSIRARTATLQSMKKDAKDFLCSGRSGRRLPCVAPGLLHMRPFLWWMKLFGFRSTGPATRLISVSCSCFRTLLIWQNPLFLQNGCDSPLSNKPL